MAFGLAVYASPDGLPAYDARLASGRWSSSTGRAFHPQDSYERFQICFLHFIPLSQACLAQSHRPGSRTAVFRKFHFPTELEVRVSGTYSFTILDLSFPTSQSERNAMVQIGFEKSEMEWVLQLA